MHVLQHSTRTDRALAAHRRNIDRHGSGLCGQVATCFALDLIDAGHDAIVETAICYPNGKRAAHAYVVTDGKVIDRTTGYEGCAEEYRSGFGVDRDTLVGFNRTALRKIAKRAASEGVFGAELFRASHPAVYAHTHGNDQGGSQ